MNSARICNAHVIIVSSQVAHTIIPLNVFSFRVVDHLHDYGNGTLGNHMYYHVYHEGIGK